MGDERKGVTHAYPIEKLIAFRAVPAADKLAWLEEMRRFLDRFQGEREKEIMRRFRRGEI